MTGYYILSFVLGIAIWYLAFYLTYSKRNVIDELRKNLKHANQEIKELSWEHDEIIAQNDILRAKTKELLDKHDDMSQVIAELSRYYINIKKASQKSSELSNILTDPDLWLDDKISQYKDFKEPNTDKKFF